MIEEVFKPSVYVLPCDLRMLLGVPCAQVLSQGLACDLKGEVHHWSMVFKGLPFKAMALGQHCNCFNVYALQTLASAPLAAATATAITIIVAVAIVIVIIVVIICITSSTRVIAVAAAAIGRILK